MEAAALVFQRVTQLKVALAVALGLRLLTQRRFHPAGVLEILRQRERRAHPLRPSTAVQEEEAADLLRQLMSEGTEATVV